MSFLFNILFYQPILNLLIFLYNIVPGNDLGVAIILLTLIVKFALYPLSRKSIVGQKALQDLQPKIEALKVKYAGNKEEMGRAMMNLYKENKVNPLSSCLPLLIQLPFLIAIFRVFSVGFENGAMDKIYSFIQRPEIINSISLGLVDLSKPNYILAILSGAAQFWQTRMLVAKRPEVKANGAKDEDMMAMMNKQMMYIMPAMTVFIGFTLPGGLTLYWLVSTLFQAIQQYLMMKKSNDGDTGGVVEGEIVK